MGLRGLMGLDGKKKMSLSAHIFAHRSTIC